MMDLSLMHIMAYKAAAKRQIRKQLPCLGNSSVSKFPRKQIHKQQQSYFFFYIVYIPYRTDQTLQDEALTK
jgi:hypothetical protein